MELLISGIALGVSVLSFLAAGWSAFAAHRSAKAAELDTQIQQGVLAEMQAQTRIQQQALTTPAPIETGPDVSFEIEKSRGQTYVLRNTGNKLAERVTVNVDHPTARDLPDGMSLAPGQGAVFLIAGVMGHPVPSEVHVAWDGGERFVPMPVSVATRVVGSRLRRRPGAH